MKIGFIGQGFIGGNMADEMEARGVSVVRFSPRKHPEGIEALKECGYVFVAVPTPTKDRKFDDSVLIDAMKYTRPGQGVIIKSTVLPGTTDKLQELYPDRFFFHSAEFLTEKNAKDDVVSPTRNVVGYTEVSKHLAEDVMRLLPRAPMNFIVTARESELGKYMSNFLLTTKVIMANIIYDICENTGIDYTNVSIIAGSDPRIGHSHLTVNHDGGRGANGHCFPKDLAALTQLYNTFKGCMEGQCLLGMMELYNIHLNYSSGKQLDILREVYGKGADRVGQEKK